MTNTQRKVHFGIKRQTELSVEDEAIQRGQEGVTVCPEQDRTNNQITGEQKVFVDCKETGRADQKAGLCCVLEKV